MGANQEEFWEEFWGLESDTVDFVESHKIQGDVHPGLSGRRRGRGVTGPITELEAT